MALQTDPPDQAHFLWKDGTKPGWLENVVDEPAPRAAYLKDVVRILESYSEPLRVAEGLRSGRATRRNES
ncbi:MAG: hypothetical protein O6951_08970 [Actinobacteria bacterium]|nr:hypothetical protein [Actinomycetota bacterium]